MAKSYLDDNGLLYFWQKIKAVFAPKASPAFTGTPTAPTATAGTSNSQIATTEFVANAVGSSASDVSDVQVDGTSVVTNGVANIPLASSSKKGAVKVGNYVDPSDSYNALAITYMSGSLAITKYVASVIEAAPGMRGLMSAADKTKLNKLVFDGNNLIDSSILPSYVDDVIEVYPRSGQTELSQNWLSLTSGGAALTPETGKIYILMADSTSYATNTQFRWSGTAYVKMLDGGVTSITNAEIDTIVAS